MPKDYVKLMQPILTRREREELRKARIVIFDPKMSEGNTHILDIPNLLGLIRGKKAVTEKVKEWGLIHMRDKHAAPSILTDLEKMLGLEAKQ